MTDIAQLGIRIDSQSAVTAASNLDRMAVSGKRAEVEANKLSRTAQDLQRGLASAVNPANLLRNALGGIGATVALGKVISDFAQFEKGLISVGKTTDIAGKELKKLGDSILTLSTKLPNSAKELTGIAAAAGQLGVTGSANILKFTETVARLGSATNLSGEEAATTLARMLTVTGESISSVDKLGSVIVRLGNNFAATEREIATIATTVAQSTALFQTTSAQAAAIGAAMASLGIQAEVGGTVVGQAFSQINKALQEGGAQMALLQKITGETGDALKREFADNATAVFQKFIEGLGKIEGSKVVSVLNELELSGIRTERVLGTLATRPEELARSLSNAADEMLNTNALMKESETAMKSLSARFDIAKNKATEFGIRLVGAFSGGLQDVVQSMGNAFEAMTKHINDVVTVMQLLAVIVGGRLVAAFGAYVAVQAQAITGSIAKAAAQRAEIVATVQAIQAHVASTAANLAEARAYQAQIVELSIYGAQRAAANVAVAQAATLHGAAAASLAVHTAAMAAYSVGARAAAIATTLLTRALAFFGGPIGASILAIGAAIVILGRNAREAADQQAELSDALATVNNYGRDSVDIANDAAIATANQTREIIAQEIALKNLAAQKLRDKGADKPGALGTDFLAMRTLEIESKNLQRKLNAADNRVSELKTGFIGPVKPRSAMGESGFDAGNLSDQEKAITKITDALKHEKDALDRLLASELKGGEESAKLTARIEAENKLRAEGIPLTSAAGRAVLALAEANAELSGSIDTVKHQEEMDLQLASMKRLLEAEKEGAHQAMLMAARIKEENVQLALGNDLRDASVQLQIDEAVALAELGYQIDMVKDKRTADAKALADWNREQEKLLDHVAENIFDSWTNMFRELLDGGKDAFKNFGDSLVNIFKDVIAQMAVLAIARPIIVPMIGTIGGMMGLSQQTIAGVTNNFGGGVGGGGALGNVANVASLGKSLSGMGSSLFTGAGSVARDLAFGAQVTGANIAANGFTGSMGTNLGSAWANATSGNFSMALGQAAPYLPILGGMMYGYSQHGVQGAVTGGLGAWGGAELGTLLLGPGLGTLIGGTVGGLLGGSIGPKPSNKSGTATIDLMSGETEIGGMTGKKFSQANRDSAAELAKGAKEIADLLKNTLGGQFTQKVSIEVGSRDGIVVGVGNQPRVNYGYNSEALAAGLIDQIVDSMTGVSAEVRTALDNLDFSNLEQAVIDLQFIADYTSGDMFKVESINAAQAALDQLNATFDAVASEAERLGLSTARAETERTNAINDLKSGFLDGINDQINAIVDPLGEVLKAQEIAAEDRLEQARTLGVSLVEVERLNMLEREQIIKQAYQGINDYLESLQLSQLSPLMPQERLDAAQGQFDQNALLAMTGNMDAINALPQLAQQLLTEGANFYAGTEQYQNMFDNVTSVLNGIVSNEPIASEPAVEAIDNMAAQSILNTVDIVAAVDALKDETSALNKVQGFMLAIMKTFLASAAA